MPPRLVAVAVAVLAVAAAVVSPASASMSDEPCLMGPPPVGAGPDTFACTYNVRVPFEAVLEGGCVPEPIAVSGELGFVEHITERAFDYTLTTHRNIHAEGVGLVTGDEYTFRSEFHVAAIDRVPGAAVFTGVALATWTAPGAHNDAYVRIVNHVTYVYETGEYAVSFEHVDAGCR